MPATYRDRQLSISGDTLFLEMLIFFPKRVRDFSKVPRELRELDGGLTERRSFGEDCGVPAFGSWKGSRSCPFHLPPCTKDQVRRGEGVPPGPGPPPRGAPCCRCGAHGLWAPPLGLVKVHTRHECLLTWSQTSSFWKPGGHELAGLFCVSLPAGEGANPQLPGLGPCKRVEQGVPDVLARGMEGTGTGRTPQLRS